MRSNTTSLTGASPLPLRLVKKHVCLWTLLQSRRALADRAVLVSYFLVSQQRWQGPRRYCCHNFNSSLGSNRNHHYQRFQAGRVQEKTVYWFTGTHMKTPQGINLEVWGPPSKEPLGESRTTEIVTCVKDIRKLKHAKFPVHYHVQVH